jgi:Tfp pilus assembly protein PilF
VVRSGDAIRVTAQLIRASDDRHLWAQDYNRSVSNILQLQNDVAGAIAGEIQLRLDSPPTRTTAPLRQVKPEAYEAYLRAREREYNLTPVDLQASVDELKHAIALDPSYAFAYSALADVYGWQAGMKSEPPAKVFPLAREAALKALQLDSTLGEPHLVLAWLKHADEWDSAGARSEFETALRLTPSDAIGHGTYAIFLAMDGHPTEALAHARRAEELDPLSAHISSLVEIALMSVGQYDAALSQAKRTRELDPKRGACYEKSAWTYWAKTEYLKSIDAEEENDKACGTWSDEHHLTYQQRRRALSEGGVRRLAELHLKSLLRPGGQETDNFDIADTYAVLQDRARTLEYLKRACRAHDEGVRFELNRSQEFRFLRSDPQFRDILKKAGFSD